MANLDSLRDFVVRATRLVERRLHEHALLELLGPELEKLLHQDDWLPDSYANPGSSHHRQYLLHADPLERLSIVSRVWAPGERSPIHNHRVWGLIGVLRGAQTSTIYRRTSDWSLRPRRTERLENGSVLAVSPLIGDIVSIANAHDDRVSVSIHVHGGNIGAIERSVFDATTGAESLFVSGYSNAAVPNLWDRSKAA
jgi:predicted metal-dependent enzyme (double-stranded beta helix superfamily)